MPSIIRLDTIQNPLGTNVATINNAGNILIPGSVVQVVHSASTTATTVATTSYTQVGGSNLSVTITPKFANSRILIMANVGYYSPAGISGYMAIFRGGGAVNLAEHGYYGYQAGEFNYGAISVYDTPNTTSPTIYSIYARGGSTTGWTVNYSDGGGTVRSTITAFEIAQ